MNIRRWIAPIAVALVAAAIAITAASAASSRNHSTHAGKLKIALANSFIATQLHGKGNIVMVTGVAGTSVDTDRNNGVESVIKKYSNMKIVAHYTGNWDSSAAQRATAAQLPSLPQVDGVWVSGGTDGVVKAFIDANKPLPIVAGEGENGYRRYLPPAGYK